MRIFFQTTPNNNRRGKTSGLWRLNRKSGLAGENESLSIPFDHQVRLTFVFYFENNSFLLIEIY
jgi:hypothetical protein